MLCRLHSGAAAAFVRVAVSCFDQDKRSAKNIGSNSMAGCNRRRHHTLLGLPCRGLPVFTVPGVSLTVPTHRGEVRFAPLFLSRRQLDRTVSAVQDIVASSVRHAPRTFAAWCCGRNRLSCSVTGFARDTELSPRVCVTCSGM